MHVARKRNLSVHVARKRNSLRGCVKRQHNDSTRQRLSHECTDFAPPFPRQTAASHTMLCRPSTSLLSILWHHEEFLTCLSKYRKYLYRMTQNKDTITHTIFAQGIDIDRFREKFVNTRLEMRLTRFHATTLSDQRQESNNNVRENDIATAQRRHGTKTPRTDESNRRSTDHLLVHRRIWWFSRVRRTRAQAPLWRHCNPRLTPYLQSSKTQRVAAILSLTKKKKKNSTKTKQKKTNNSPSP